MSTEKYTWDGQDAKVVDKIHGKIVDMLTAGESINYIAVQKRPAVTLFPDSITVSNKRIFLGEFTKLGLATNFEIFLWKDIKDISFKEEIFGSRVTVIPFTGENLTIDYIPKVQARKLYQLIKDALDQIQKGKSNDKQKAMVEPDQRVERPVEPMNQIVPEESKREQEPTMPVANSSTATPTASTSVNMPPAAPSINDTFRSSRMDQPTKTDEEDELAKKLTRLKSLFDRQLISQAEYESKKSEILKDL